MALGKGKSESGNWKHPTPYYESFGPSMALVGPSPPKPRGPEKSKKTPFPWPIAAELEPDSWGLNSSSPGLVSLGTSSLSTGCSLGPSADDETPETIFLLSRGETTLLRHRAQRPCFGHAPNGASRNVTAPRMARLALLRLHCQQCVEPRPQCGFGQRPGRSWKR